MVKKYFERHFHLNQIFDSSSDEPLPGSLPRPKKKSFKNFDRFIVFLGVLPYLCLAAFVFSFFWDLGPSHDIEIFGLTVTFKELIRTLSVAGLIGYGTNWLAIKMLFRPVVRRPIWGQGLIPAQRDRIIYQLAGGIHKHILSEELIKRRIEDSGIIKNTNRALIKGTDEMLHDEEFRKEIKDLVFTHLEANMTKPEVREKIVGAINSHLEEAISSGISGLVFKTYKKVRKAEYEKLIHNVLDNLPFTAIGILDELENEIPQLTKMLKDKQEDLEEFYMRVVISVLERINITRILNKQMSHLDESGLEQMIRGATNKQLLYIQYLGTLLGLLGGLLISNPLPILILYGSILGILYFADILLFRMKKKKSRS